MLSNPERSAVELYVHVLDVLSKPNQISIRAVCNEIVVAVENNAFHSFFSSLDSFLKYSGFVHVETLRDESIYAEDSQNRDPMNCKKAFNWPHQDRQALEAFEEYLDVQWLQMYRLYLSAKSKPGRERLSRVGLMIQSSCAGKSRLVQE